MAVTKDIARRRAAYEQGLKELVIDGQRKLRWELLPLDAVEQVVKVLTAGAEKYSANSWQNVDSEHYLGALLRHLSAWRQGEQYDSDLEKRGCKVSHLACVATNALFLLWQELHRKDMNNE